MSCNTPQVSGLKYGAKYNYRLFAENAAGVSEPSNVIGPMLADDLHGESKSDSFSVWFCIKKGKMSGHSERKRFESKAQVAESEVTDLLTR